MILAKFIHNEKDFITGFNISGHSGSAQKGNDIICSAVSSPAYMVANTVTEILKLEADIQEKDGLLSVLLNEKDAVRAADILNGFLLHMEELEKMYPDFIKVERGAK